MKIRAEAQELSSLFCFCLRFDIQIVVGATRGVSRCVDHNKSTGPEAWGLAGRRKLHNDANALERRAILRGENYAINRRRKMQLLSWRYLEEGVFVDPRKSIGRAEGRKKERPAWDASTQINYINWKYANERGTVSRDEGIYNATLGDVKPDPSGVQGKCLRRKSYVRAKFKFRNYSKQLSLFWERIVLSSSSNGGQGE